MTGLPLNIDWQQIVLHLFNFVLLTGGLYILLYKPVKDFIEKRKKYYQSMDEAANETLDKAMGMKKEYEQKLKDAEEEIGRMKNEAAAASREASRRQLDEAAAQSEKIISDARLKAQAEHDRLIAGANEEVVALAAAAAAKIIDGDSDIYDSFVKSVAEEGADDK